MRLHASLLVLLVLSALLTACQRQNNVELTLVARGLNLETQISALRQTATVGAERLEVTLDYMATRVEFARRQRQELEATLSARGTPFPGSISGPTGTPFPLPDNVNVAPTVAVATALPQQLSGQARFTDIVMAASVRDNDCATQPQFDFRVNAERIYVVATAWNIRANTRIAARFVISGRESLLEWRPGAPINGNCIWFYIEQSDLPFVAGNWSVRLEINGVPASDSLTFSIRDL
ncbi:MAG: hypothetical protein OXF44_01765 [Anaerolineaceae bacterium]|nr:hypothetical protein [Anaerolineaceae bacterium]MCY4023960.1 hypothetical protein [Anaerolineaceae bacterium]